MSTLQIISLILYAISYLFLFVALFFSQKTIKILKEKLDWQRIEKDLKLLSVLYDIKELTDYRKTFDKEAIRDYVNKEIKKLSKECSK